MSDGYQELFHETVRETAPYLNDINLNFKLIGTSKGSNIITVRKEGQITEYLTKEDCIITVTLFEEAFELLSPEYRKLVLVSAIDSIEHDSEKDVTSVKNNKGTTLSEGAWIKHGADAVNAIFSGIHAVRQIAEEAKNKKMKS